MRGKETAVEGESTRVEAKLEAEVEAAGEAKLEAEVEAKVEPTLPRSLDDLQAQLAALKPPSLGSD
tara:strand:- start:622 stop:819 length:198 start_codon:yes stop_codon:yes gene_type:complete